MMDKILSIAEIGSYFDSEWVLVEDPETDERLEVQRGKVLWHSKDREEVNRKLLELRPQRFALLYIGAPAKDMEFVL